jgi:beta-glucosidase
VQFNRLNRLSVAGALLLAALPRAAAASAESESWRNPDLPISVRVANLVRQLTLPEKISLLSCDGPAIPRLGVPAYSHRNECLHGIINDGVTIFPQAIGMAATWDQELIRAEADAIATEARAKSNAYAATHGGNLAMHYGLSYYSPNLNLFRDPRWGRGQETYGEDPFLISRIGVAFIRGLQGDDPRYIKVIAGAKHFAVHSGPERGRHGFAVYPSERDLFDSYLPAFEAAVREAHVGSVMAAHSAVFGIPDCANAFLLGDLLRKTWGFDGFVVTDGGGIYQIWAAHQYAATPAEADADALNAGCDIASGGVEGDRTTMRSPANWARQKNGHAHGGEDFEMLPAALAEGLTTESRVNAAVARELTARFRLGLFDPPDRVPWSRIGPEKCDAPAHRELALRVARESLVLLKNDGLLPLDRAKLRRIAVVGPNAHSRRMLLGNYNGANDRTVTVLEGIRQLAGPGVTVTYEAGCPLALKGDGSNRPNPSMAENAVAAANAADVVIFVAGIDATLEREELDGQNVQGFDGGDRSRIELPLVQESLIQALWATGRPLILVDCSGGAMALRWERDHVGAMMQAWYPGEEGGRAVAEAIFGAINPAGRLPITFYRSTGELPPFADYSMQGRTYRYFKGSPLFAFGHGLSYTSFTYSKPRLAPSPVPRNGKIELEFTVLNSGKRSGDEVAQVYCRSVPSDAGRPRLELCAFRRLTLAPGESTRVDLLIPASRLRHWDTARHHYEVEPGSYELLIGAASDDLRLAAGVAVR